MTLFTPTSARKLMILLAAAVTLGLAALAPAAAANGPVPFTANSTGTAAWTSPTTVDFRGTGNGTHLGRFEFGGLAVIEPAPVTCPDGAPGLVNVHVETLRAANGDELVIRMVDVGCPTGPSTFHGTGTWTVLSGTGRFEGATGEGTCDGGADFATGAFWLTLTGTLSYR